MIAIIILAAGASTRMGKPKQLLPYHQSSLIAYITQEAIASICNPVIVVLGAFASQIQPELNNLPIHLIENPHWAEGMSSSIRLGIEYLQNLPDEIEACIFLVCDQPFISSSYINQLVESYQSTHYPIIASAYSDILGVPALFESSLFPDLLTLRSNQGAKQIIKKYSSSVFSLSFPEGAVDLDTPEDYRFLEQVISKTFF